MADRVAITDLQMAALDTAQMTQPMVESGVAWYEVTATIGNRSAETMYVMASVRRTQYEAARHALVFDLSEHNRVESSRFIGLPLPPAFTVIPAGGDARIVWRVSSPVVSMELGAGHDAPHFIHLGEDVERIECIVAYSDVAPQVDPNLASMEPISDLRGWGEVARGSLTVKDTGA